MTSFKPLGAVLFVGLLLAGAGCVHQRAPESRTISVQDLRGRPIAGARVYVQGHNVVTQVSTGRNGTASVPLVDHPVSIVVSHPGYQVVALSSKANESLVRVVMKEDH